VGEVLPGPMPGCTIRVEFGGGAVVGVLGFFLEALPSDFSLGSFDLAAEPSSFVTSLAAMSPRVSCSNPCPAHAEKDSKKGGRKGD